MFAGGARERPHLVDDAGQTVDDEQVLGAVPV